MTVCLLFFWSVANCPFLSDTCHHISAFPCLFSRPPPPAKTVTSNPRLLLISPVWPISAIREILAAISGAIKCYPVCLLAISTWCSREVCARAANGHPLDRVGPAVPSTGCTDATSHNHNTWEEKWVWHSSLLIGVSCQSKLWDCHCFRKE